MTMNIIIGVLCLAISIGLYASTFAYTEPSAIGIGPGTWPRVIACLIGLCSLILIVQSLLRRVPSGSGLRFNRKAFQSCLVPGVIVVSVLVYILVWAHLRTFFIPTFLLTTLIVILLKEKRESILDYLSSGLIGLVLTTVIYVVFYYVFRLPL